MPLGMNAVNRLESPPLRVLLVDDEDVLLVPIKRFFERRGHVVSATTEPELAEALLEHQAYDVVFLDLALTRFGREGLEVLASMRAEHEFLPIVILSACISDEIEREALRMGADAVLRKPQDLVELARLAERLCGRA